MLTELFDKIWKEEGIPKDWEVKFTKGDISSCSNYKGIILLSVVLKVYEEEKNMKKRVREILDKQLGESQSNSLN